MIDNFIIFIKYLSSVFIQILEGNCFFIHKGTEELELWCNSVNMETVFRFVNQAFSPCVPIPNSHFRSVSRGIDELPVQVGQGWQPKNIFMGFFPRFIGCPRLGFRISVGLPVCSDSFHLVVLIKMAALYWLPFL